MLNPIISEPIGSSAELLKVVKSYKNGIFTLKPRVLFSKIEDTFENPTDLLLHIPSSQIGSVTLLEASSLASITKLIEPKGIFEIGTFLGYSTALLLRNTLEDCTVYSIDLGDETSTHEKANNYSDEELRSDDKKNDDYLRLTQSKKGPIYLNNLTEKQQSRLQLIHGDSTKLDIKKLNLSNKIDFIFVDGGHDATTIQADAIKATEMSSQNGIIMWHDYGSSIHSDVTNYIDEYSKSHLIFHIENTMLAFYCNNEFNKKLLFSGL